MHSLWITLPKSWHLSDVQAHVQLGALLSINTLGEVYDACWLLKLGVLSTHHWHILSQCTVVTILSIVTFLAGIIVRYSTTLSPEIALHNVPVLLANREVNGIDFATLVWNTTQQSLNSARFPHDRLLDFLPESNIDWRYVESDWRNSTWYLDCEYSAETFTNWTVVETPCEQDTSLNSQIPAFESIFPENEWYKSNNTWVYSNYDGFSDNSRWSHLLMFRNAFIFLKNDSADIWEDTQITLLAAHIQDIGTASFDEPLCSFSPGPIGRVSYTKARCKLTKRRKTAANLYYANISHPDANSLDFIPQAYTEFFQSNFSKQVRGTLPITLVSGLELVRFYQVYLISQDTQYRLPAFRRVSVVVKVVQISTVFLSICGLIALLCTVGMAKYVMFWIRYRSEFADTPQSKIDWMVQSVEGATSRTTRASAEKFRYSVTSARSPEPRSAKARKKSDFETALYGISSLIPQSARPDSLARHGSEGSYLPLIERCSSGFDVCIGDNEPTDQKVQALQKEEK